jgi:hypothetical protein
VNSTPRGLIRPRSLGPLVFAAALLVYLITLSPTVGYVDCGELSAVVTTLGVAHPSGYPLFTLLGRLFSLLPTSGEVVVRLNIMAALFCAAAAFTFFHFLLALFTAGGRTESPGGGVERSVAAAAGAALLLAYSRTFWSQALSVEVYSLHVLLICLTLLLFVRAVQTGSSRLWNACAFVLGLSFSNHLTTVLLVPGLLYWTVAARRERRTLFSTLARAVPWFLLGLTPYVVLPLRASCSPALSWGDVVSVDNLLRHISGWQYRVWMLSSLDVAGRQLSHFLSSWPAEFGYVGVALVLPGWVAMWRETRRLFVFTLLLFLSSLLYAINYNIHDIDSYFLLAFLATAVWAGFGIRALGVWFSRRVAIGRRLGVVLPLSLCIVPMVGNYGRTDQSRNFVVEDYTRNMFSSFAPGALVLSYQWDYWVSAANYYQLVDGLRSDVIVLDKELLRRSWYLAQIEKRYPALVAENRSAVEAFLAEVYKFEHGLRYEANVIEARYVGMIRGFVEKGLPVRPVYVTPEIEGEFTRPYRRVPEGLALRVYADTVFHPNPFPEFPRRPFPGNSDYEPFVRRFYGAAYAARADYYRVADPLEARRAASAAHALDPTMLQAFGRSR